MEGLFFSLRWPPNTSPKHNVQPTYPYSSVRWEKRHCDKWTHKELWHHRALSLAEENPKLGNFLFLSQIKSGLHWCIFLDIWINEPNASSEFKTILWHLKLFLALQVPFVKHQLIGFDVIQKLSPMLCCCVPRLWLFLSQMVMSLTPQSDYFCASKTLA